MVSWNVAKEGMRLDPMSELEAMPTRDVTARDAAPPSPRAVTTARMLTAGRLSFVAGCGLGWLFREELVNLLTQPWEVFCSPPYAEISSSLPLRWFVHTSATAGTLLAFPFATWLGWALVARRSCPRDARSIAAFLFSSYCALGLGLGVAALVTLPAFVDAQRGDPDLSMIRPSSWAFVEPELRWSLDVALVAQVGQSSLRS
jgi:hypothetical protein